MFSRVEHEKVLIITKGPGMTSLYSLYSLSQVWFFSAISTEWADQNIIPRLTVIS